MREARLFVLAALLVGLLCPGIATATTIRLGPEVPAGVPEGDIVCIPAICPGGRTFSQLVSPGLLNEAPASGVIKTWRVSGDGALKLRVLRRVGEEEEELVAVGTSAPASNTLGGANATSLPIRAGDVIGVDEPAGTGSEVASKEVGSSSTVLLGWEPALVDGAAFRETKGALESNSKEVMLSADIVLAPVVSSVTPVSGGTAGGNTVKINGLFFTEGGATGVTFGSAPASSFSVDSSTQITAIAPASSASTVDMRVTGLGGSSEVSAADRAARAGPARQRPVRRRLTRNAGKAKCSRTAKAGSIALPGHAGLDKIRFQGRLSSAKTLKPGTFTVTISARDAHGLTSLPHSLSFTIVSH